MIFYVLCVHWNVLAYALLRCHHAVHDKATVIMQTDHNLRDACKTQNQES